MTDFREERYVTVMTLPYYWPHRNTVLKYLRNTLLNMASSSTEVGSLAVAGQSREEAVSLTQI